MRKIGIKYCGGCNPNYERVEIVQRVQFLMKDRFLFLCHDQEDLDALVKVNGCPRTCAEKSMTRINIPCWSFNGEVEFERLIEWLNTLEGAERGDDFTASTAKEKK